MTIVGKKYASSETCLIKRTYLNQMWNDDNNS